MKRLEQKNVLTSFIAIIRLGGNMFIDKKLLPSCLQDMQNPPNGLYYKGNVDLLNKRKITIVGTRRPTSYGVSITKKIVAKYKLSDIVIVSGFANGIDFNAHMAALDNNIPTIAIIGCGIDVMYPKNKKLRERLDNKNSLILSEYDYGVTPKPYHFPLRNRLLAAISDDIIVVECSIKSGTMITAKHAIEMGKELWVVPGRIDNPMSMGPNYLIFQGANPIYTLDLINF